MKQYMERFINWYKEIGQDYLITTLNCFLGSLTGFLIGCKIVGFW